MSNDDGGLSQAGPIAAIVVPSICVAAVVLAAAVYYLKQPKAKNVDAYASA